MHIIVCMHGVFENKIQANSNWIWLDFTFSWENKRISVKIKHMNFEWNKQGMWDFMQEKNQQKLLLATEIFDMHHTHLVLHLMNHIVVGWYSVWTTKKIYCLVYDSHWSHCNMLLSCAPKRSNHFSGVFHFLLISTQLRRKKNRIFIVQYCPLPKPFDGRWNSFHGFLIYTAKVWEMLQKNWK